PPARQPPSGLRAPPVFSNHRLQRFLVQAQIRHQLPQPRVLVTQLLRFLRLAHIHPPVLRLPRVDRVLRYPHFPRHILDGSPCVDLFQGRDHLRLAVPAPRHAYPPFFRRNHNQFRAESGEQVRTSAQQPILVTASLLPSPPA